VKERGGVSGQLLRKGGEKLCQACDCPTMKVTYLIELACVHPLGGGGVN
jgi:hypothetical protein